MPDTAIPFLRTLQSEAAAGDPLCQQTVLQLADWLETERGDPRAGWLRQQNIEEGNCPKEHPRDSNGFWVNPGPHWFRHHRHALQELSRRVMEAMTRECQVTSSPQTAAFAVAVCQFVDCPDCHGDGFLLTEAEWCGCDGGRFHHLNGETVQCPDCAGKGWRIKNRNPQTASQ